MKTTGGVIAKTGCGAGRAVKIMERITENAKTL
jgi:hypothetical protein